MPSTFARTLALLIELELLSNDGEELTTPKKGAIQGSLALESPDAFVEVRTLLHLGDNVRRNLRIPGKEFT